MRNQALERRGMKSKARDRFETPAKPRSDEREGRGARIGDPFVATKLLGKACAHPVPERITGGEHCCRPVAATHHDFRIERHRPSAAAAGDACKCKMALTTED